MGLLRRSLQICLQRLGPAHADTVRTRGTLAEAETRLAMRLSLEEAAELELAVRMSLEQAAAATPAKRERSDPPTTAVVKVRLLDGTVRAFDLAPVSTVRDLRALLDARDPPRRYRLHAYGSPGLVDPDETLHELGLSGTLLIQKPD